MLFSNIVATIRTDFGAIKEDLGEFVSTVKTDTVAMLGLGDGETEPDSTNDAGGNGKYIQWEEELWENPELLCEDPAEDEAWAEFAANPNAIREEEVEALLAGSTSEVIPELYRELVPSRVTHADFVKRLIFHREQFNNVIKSKVQELVMNDEEETRWDDESIGEEPVKSTSTEPVVSQSSQQDERLVEENEQLRQELSQCRLEMTKLLSRVNELEAALKQSEAHKVELESKLAERAELPHAKKPVSEPSKQLEVPKVEEEEEDNVPAKSPSPKVMPKIAAAVPSPSWEALPTSPSSSSNEEPVILSRTDDDEEDDWE